MTSRGEPPSDSIAFDDDLVDRLLRIPESDDVEFKRIGDNARKPQTIVAFSNTRGGTLFLGIEDQEKAIGRDRVFGVQENPTSVDELTRLVSQRITPPLASGEFPSMTITEIGCTLRDGSKGSIVVIRVSKSVDVHSLVDGGTYVRMSRSNRQISAAEIVDLSMQRGTRSWVSGLADVSIDLIETALWREYAAAR